jgi:hypothetical protein
LPINGDDGGAPDTLSCVKSGGRKRQILDAPLKSRLPPVAGSVGTMSQCCSANVTRPSLCSRKPLRAMGLQSATMNDIACWLRAQIPSSIDPARLERLAREAERQAVLRGGIATMVRERSPSKPFVSSDSGTKASVVSLGRPQGRSDDVVPASSMPRDGN